MNTCKHLIAPDLPANSTKTVICVITFVNTSDLHLNATKRIRPKVVDSHVLFWAAVNHYLNLTMKWLMTLNQPPLDEVCLTPIFVSHALDDCQLKQIFFCIQIRNKETDIFLILIDFHRIYLLFSSNSSKYNVLGILILIDWLFAYLLILFNISALQIDCIRSAEFHLS